jgi:UPF0755 protein
MSALDKKNRNPGLPVRVIVNLIVFLVLLGLSFAAGLGAGFYYAIMPAGTGTPVRFDVPKGAPAKEVARKLEHAGLVRSALLFRFTLYCTKSERDIKPGNYLIDPASTMMDVLSQLKKGNFKLHLVTIPEGLTMSEIAALMEKNGVVRSRDFINAMVEKKFIIGRKKLSTLEGFLLPETYDFPQEYGAGDVLDAMLKTFEKRVLPLYEARKDSLPVRLSLTQAIVLASMVEREAQVPSERPVIAMVYYNRLKKNMKMECDATIQYALGKQKSVLKLSDLKINSPYNTYLHQGLPPAPIANPGIDCIRAALNPSPAEYLYYVRNDKKNDGSHVFSRTFKEHNEAIRNYQK